VCAVVEQQHQRFNGKISKEKKVFFLTRTGIVFEIFFVLCKKLETCQFGKRLPITLLPNAIE